MVSKKQTIVLNGKTYDVTSGRPVSGAPKPPARVISDIAPPKRKVARNVAPHAKNHLQKSTTLKRAPLKKPVTSAPRETTASRPKIQRSKHITKFAPTKHHVAPSPKNLPDNDLVAQTRALEKAHAEYLASQQQETTPINPRAVKEHLLHQAVAKVPTHTINSHQANHRIHKKKKGRFTNLAMTSVALIVLGGYLTYTNIPNLSIRVAAANSGVDATLPSYQPSGYSIHGPITYSDGEVNVKYQQTGTNEGYKLTQRPTDWDPIATLDNYVESDSKNDYQTRSVQGLTVYTYNNKAVWVNGGILHIIDGNAPLSGQQVERIVASM